MLSLQSVQVEQLLPQAQAQSLQTQAEPKRAEKSDFSFLDLLRSEQQIDASEPKDVSQVNDEPQRPVSDKNLAEHTEKKDDAVHEKLPQDEKSRVSQKETETDAQAEAVDAELVALLGLEQPLMVEEKHFTVAYRPDSDATAVQELAAADENAVPINQIGVELNNLAWLYAARTEAADGAEEIAVDDDALAELLDETAFLVPQIDADDDDLAQIQQFAVEHPAAFLQDAEQVLAKAADTDGDTSFGEKKIEVKDAKAKPRLEITDLRTQKTDASVETQNAVGKAQSKNGADFAFEQKNEPSVQMTMEMTGATAIDQNITSANTQTAAANGSNFQSMLANAIQENAPDFVKAGNIVLRDGNQGAINLILRPESLGNVKISLSLSDKVITGQITVQSQEAYNAFKDSIDSLKAAFAAGGFEAQGFDLNFAGNQQFAQGQNEWQNPEFAIRAGETYGDFVSSGEIDASVAAYEYSDYGINIVA